MQEKFRKYTEGACSAEEFKETWDFMTDPKNNKLLGALLRENWAQSKSTGNGAAPNKQLLNQIHHKIALTESYPGKTLRLYQAISGIAVVLIVGLILGIILYPKQQQQDNGTVAQSISAPFGGKAHFSLSDGTEVWLNSGSAITYPVRFSDTRQVTLTGQAYFKVTHSPNPFVVSGKFGQIEVLGTEFDIKAYEGENTVATLVKGSVIFKNNSNKQVRLKPGFQAICKWGEMYTKKVDTKLYTSWKDGKLIFEEEPLINIVTRLERWYNVDIKLEGESIRNLKYTGTIEMESFSEVLELIKVTTPIRYSFDRDTRTLTITSEN